MVRLSRARLIEEAREAGFRDEIFEKVLLLVVLLEKLFERPFFRERMALKGGTALNLFIFNIPRLSVDIDINYVGSAQREVMLAERPEIDAAVRAVCQGEGFTVRRAPKEHAGGKWSLRYDSALGHGGNLGIDINYLVRVPLWPLQVMDSRPIGSLQAKSIPLMDLHELAGGKISALFDRRASRDLFDAHRIFQSEEFDAERLRTAFVVYGAMKRKDIRLASVEAVTSTAEELEQQLLPVLKTEERERIRSTKGWAQKLVEECRAGLATLLPSRPNERDFLDRVLDHGEVVPELLTDDEDLQDRIRVHPGLQWKALNVRKYKGKG